MRTLTRTKIFIQKIRRYSMVKMLNSIENIHTYPYRKKRMDEFDISLVRELLCLLEPFKIGSEILSSENQPILHLILLFVKKFKQAFSLIRFL